MSVKGLPKLTPSQYKMMNGQLGSVIVHKGEFIVLSMDGQWRGITEPYAVEAPTCIDEDTAIEHRLISTEKDTIIDGRFLAWQIGGQWWLYITSYTYLSDNAKPIKGKPYLIQYHEYKGS
ncbi:hypothetical protein AH04_164 [Erwinia phage AH04]|uniref:Uncharacterized protein n=1 Tax=Erwinia phage AH04 TaxID=2869569 RepID=A0AAE7X0N2_9CAUD|nr:hypothetical protein PQC02_gp150 [Erwinia phage AH04]QZA70639.1 hypothetical protein AH04_164 [Erwinia phage AH04]